MMLSFRGSGKRAFASAARTNKKGRHEAALSSSIRRPGLEFLGVLLVTDEAHLLDAGPLGDGQNLVDQRIAHLSVRLEVELGRDATKQELAEATGLPLQHVDEALGAAHASVSLNQTVGADDEGELGDLFADREAADPFDEAEESLRRQSIRRALDALPERERRILELRFGFEGEPWTLEAIGHELDLTRERVRQLEGQALKRLEALRDLAGLAA